MTTGEEVSKQEKDRGITGTYSQSCLMVTAESKSVCTCTTVNI